MPDASLWQAAADFAARAHRHHERVNGTPYVSHPFRVALIVAAEFGETDPEILAAALLHDTIEDTGVDFDDLDARFGRRVARLVATLTKDMRLVEDEREREYDARLAQGPWEARLIKLADVLDNLHDAAGSPKQRKALEKARRALALAEGEPRLAAAAAALRAKLPRSARE